MSGLTRRQLLATATALSAAWAVPIDVLGRVLTAQAVPALDAPTTLLETIRIGSVASGSYRTLVAAPGEPHVVRMDLLGRGASAGRSAARRSLCYLGHFSDLHIIDAQSPARLEPMIGMDHALWTGAFRPHDALTVHVAAAMVKAMNDVRRSPVTGAPMTAAVVTGDSTDMLSSLEVDWFVGVLDGRTITANSGAANVYEGVQGWSEATYAWHPDDPVDEFGAMGFPRLPGMLQAAVSQPVPSVGVPVPWYSVYGNHDTLYIGTFPVNGPLREWAVGDRKAAQWPALGFNSFRGLAAGLSPLTELMNRVQNSMSQQWGVKAVTADPARRLLERDDFMRAHFDSPATPGPVGHGFTDENLQSGHTWWAADFGPFVRGIGLDTCNQVMGADGSVTLEQMQWLVAELERAQRENKLVVVLSHHNSLSLENPAEPAVGESPTLVHGEEFVATLLRHPHVIAWLNGHSHINSITPHRRDDGGGFWELTTASCIDFPQQQQVVEVVDNRDGSLSIFATVLDHRSPADYVDGDFTVTGLASLSRQLSANDTFQTPVMRTGSAVDRNCELLLPAPFDLSSISDAHVEQARAQGEARLLAREQGGSS